MTVFEANYAKMRVQVLLWYIEEFEPQASATIPRVGLILVLVFVHALHHEILN